MKWYIICSIIIACIAYWSISNSKNNVCRTFKDYYGNRDLNDNCYYNPEGTFSVPEIINHQGYPVETYNITTRDGYILKVFRIPNGKYGKTFSNKTRKQPVFLQHGLTLNSACFVNIGNKSLGFLLADAGYDVWLGNFRGTRYSKSHIQLNEEDSEFWQFDVDEYGLYDLYAQFELVYKITKQKMIYIGYSMGVISVYAYASSYPEMSTNRLKIIIAIAGTPFLLNLNPFTHLLFKNLYLIAPIAERFTNGALYLKGSYDSSIRKSFCLPYPFQMYICQTLDMIFAGIDFEQIDPETLPITLLQNTEPLSLKMLVRIYQALDSKKFMYFDYGADENKRKYGTLKPPEYNLSNVRVPSYMIFGKNDILVTKESVEHLHKMLPKEYTRHGIHIVSLDNFNHGDFINAKDVVDLVYKDLLSFLRNFK